MTYTEILHQQIEQLPASYHAEASRYLEFLLQKVGIARTPAKELPQANDVNDAVKRRQELSDIMHQIAKEGTVFSRENIDVMAWQREQRQDRVLVGREND